VAAIREEDTQHKRGADSLRLAFVIPAPRLTGGVRVVFEYARELQKHGHEVEIIWPLIPSIIPYTSRGLKYLIYGFYRMLRGLCANLIKGTKLGQCASWCPVRRVLYPTRRQFHRYNVIIATAWHTAYLVDHVITAKQEGCYLIQHYERWDGPQQLVDASYVLPLKRVVVSSWLRSIVEVQLGSSIDALIPNGIDHTQFFPEPSNWPSDRNKRVLMMYHAQPWKGVRDGVRAFERSMSNLNDVQLVMFGFEKGLEVPPSAEFHEDVQGDSLRELYNSCGIFVSTSWYEGFGLPAVEAMACGCAVVGTRVGAMLDLVPDEATCLLVEPHDIDGMAAAIIRLLADQELQISMGEHAAAAVKRFQWHAAAAALEELVRGGGT
jgi:hypothetical protein